MSKLESKLDNLESSQTIKDLAVEKKVNILENKIKTWIEAIKTKDKQLSTLETRIQDLENVVNKSSEKADLHLEKSTKEIITCTE